MDFGLLHDSVVERVLVEHAVPRVTVTLRVVYRPNGGRHVDLVAHNWTRLSCPRVQPWGRSMETQVNEVRGPVGVADGSVRIAVELQTGDIIEIEAESFELREDRVESEP